MAIQLQHQTCPNCSYKLDGAATLDPEEECSPREGDISLCINCGQILVFNSSIKLEAITDEIWREIIVHQPIEANRILKAQNLIREKSQFNSE